MRDDMSNRTASILASFLKASETEPPSLYEAEYISWMPEMAASAPSIFEVASCSTTRADAPGQLNHTVICFWRMPGEYWILSNGIMAAPISMRVAMTSITRKAELCGCRLIYFPERLR